MAESFYPPIEVRTLTAVRAAVANLRQDKEWLDGPNCPYDSAVRAGLVELTKLLLSTAGSGVATGPVQVPVDDDSDKYAALERETRQMLNDLQTFTKDMTNGAVVVDAKERMQFFRTCVSLMDKLVGLSERALNLKHVSDFQRAVLSVFDQVLDPQQRTQALKLLDEGTAA